MHFFVTLWKKSVPDKLILNHCLFFDKSFQHKEQYLISTYTTKVFTYER